MALIEIFSINTIYYTTRKNDRIITEVCRRSFELGYDGYVEFTAKTKLIEYYKRELGALVIGGQKMVIDEIAAKKLVEKYYGGKGV